MMIRKENTGQWKSCICTCPPCFYINNKKEDRVMERTIESQIREIQAKIIKEDIKLSSGDYSGNERAFDAANDRIESLKLQLAELEKKAGTK